LLRGFVVFAGVFEGGRGKSGCGVWFLGGEIVVNAWWNVDEKNGVFEDEKYASFSDYFLVTDSRVEADSKGKDEMRGFFTAFRMTTSGAWTSGT
jgi:hypothetical protein